MNLFNKIFVVFLIILTLNLSTLNTTNAEQENLDKYTEVPKHAPQTRGTQEIDVPLEKVKVQGKQSWISRNKRLIIGSLAVVAVVIAASVWDDGESPASNGGYNFSW